MTTHVRALIHRSLEDELLPAERVQLDEHLRLCDSCRQLHTELRRNDALLAQREAMPVAPARRELRPSPLRFVTPVLVTTVALLFALIAGSQLTTWRTQIGTAATATPSRTVVPTSPATGPQPTATQSVGAVGPPRCAADQIPELDVSQPLPPGDQPGTGSASAEGAFRKRYPNATDFTMYEWKSDRPSQNVSDPRRGPVWIVAGGETFVALASGSADGVNNWFAYPARFVGCQAPSADAVRTWIWVAQSALDVDGYRFMVRVVADPAYGPRPSAGPWAVSAVPGIGLSCVWTRTGPDAGKVEDLWGTPTSVVATGTGYTDVRTGASGNHVNGVPIDAVHGTVATMTCGVRDAAGQHGVMIELTIAANGQYTDSALSLSRWTTR